MSFGAGGLAQMTYNNNFAPSGPLGVPGSGFASRGKGAHIKHLSVAPPAGINSIYEDEVDQNPAPRTSRSHLLAGLRTAPKSAQPGPPASAPYNQMQHRFSPDNLSYQGGKVGRTMNRLANDAPRTATASQFPSLGGNVQYNSSVGQQMYCMPEQVLAPPNLNLEEIDYQDQQTYDNLLATNYFLAQRQQELQQKLLDVTIASQQFQGLNLNNNTNNNYNNKNINNMNTPAAFGHANAVTTAPTFTPSFPNNLSVYNQQLQSGMQPIVQPVANQPGLWAVYNPMTGGYSFVTDQALQQPNQRAISPPYSANSPETQQAPGLYRKHSNSPPATATTNINRNRTITPPKSSPSPPQQDDITPLPPPSANAFRPGHRKSMSSAFSSGHIRINGVENGEANGNPLRTAALPPTPMTGTFGPGMGRAGEHPIRQPRGPPPLEELVAKPTSKDEGSQNFATRQRRRAVHNLVKAGNQRRTGKST